MKEVYKIKLRPAYAKRNGEDVLPNEFESKNDAEVYFETEGLDYDQYHIYKVSSKTP